MTEPDIQPEQASERKPYEPPAWEEDEVFERAAGGCAKFDDSCAAGGPIQS